MYILSGTSEQLKYELVLRKFSGVPVKNCNSKEEKVKLMNFDNFPPSGGLRRANERKTACLEKLKEEVKKKKQDWVEEVVEAAGAKPGEAFLLAPRAGSSSADTLEVYTGRRLLGSRSGVGGLGHSSVFLKLPSRPLANSKVSAVDLGFPF